MTENNPRVGIGVLIQNEKGEVLIGLRKGSDGAGKWAFPGGHLDFGETIFECAKREVKEETDLDLTKFTLISVADELDYIDTTGIHYLNIGIKAEYNGVEPKLMEPNKNDGWEWFSPDNLPAPMFEGTLHTLGNFKSGKIYIGNE